MALLDEPKDREGVAQVLNTKTGDNNSTVWLNTPSATSHTRYKTSALQTLGLPSNVFSMLSDAVLWLSSAALVCKLVLGVQRLITVGILAETTALTGLLALSVPLVCLTLFVYFSIQEARGLVIYRISLFVFGVLLGVI